MIQYLIAFALRVQSHTRVVVINRGKRWTTAAAVCGGWEGKGDLLDIGKYLLLKSALLEI